MKIADIYNFGWKTKLGVAGGLMVGLPLLASGLVTIKEKIQREKLKEK